MNVAEETGSAEELAIALCERSLVAMSRGDWTLVESLAERALTTLRQEGLEESVVTPLARVTSRSKAVARCRELGLLEG